jgi:hypothetical protein
MRIPCTLRTFKERWNGYQACPLIDNVFLLIGISTDSRYFFAQYCKEFKFGAYATNLRNSI